MLSLCAIPLIFFAWNNSLTYRMVNIWTKKWKTAVFTISKISCQEGVCHKIEQKGRKLLLSVQKRKIKDNFQVWKSIKNSVTWSNIIIKTENKHLLVGWKDKACREFVTCAAKDLTWEITSVRQIIELSVGFIQTCKKYVLPLLVIVIIKFIISVCAQNAWRLTKYKKFFKVGHRNG